MKIAILGAGFAGLATAWHLLKRTRCQVILIDPAGIGGSASGIAAGLLHPYAGAHAKLNWQGHAGMKATLQLLKVAEEQLGEPVATQEGVLRVALSDAQQLDFQAAATRHAPHVLWQTTEQCQARVTGLSPHPGIFIPSAVTVNCPLYLEGLWRACQSQGAILKQLAIQSLAELEGDFDAVVVAMGAACKTLPELATLPIQAVKGQVLELGWPSSLPPLSCALNSHIYLVRQGHNRCLAGATFERDVQTPEPDLAVATAEIYPKAIALIPALRDVEILGCRAAFRASAPGHRPLVKRVSSTCWVVTGLGSKGLLYHSLLGEQVSCELVAAGEGRATLPQS